MKNYLIQLSLTLILFLLISGCASKSPHAATTIDSARFLNPNIYHQASPVVVTIYQLKSPTAFTQANFFALSNNAQATLGSDLLDKRDIEIRPKQKQILTIDLAPDTNYIGVIAAFRNPDKAQWREVKQIKSGKNIKLKIHLSTQSISIQ